MSHDSDVNEFEMNEHLTGMGKFALPTDEAIQDLPCALNGDQVKIDLDESLLEKMAKAAAKPRRKK